MYIIIIHVLFLSLAALGAIRFLKWELELPLTWADYLTMPFTVLALGVTVYCGLDGLFSELNSLWGWYDDDDKYHTLSETVAMGYTMPGVGLIISLVYHWKKHINLK